MASGVRAQWTAQINEVMDPALDNFAPSLVITLLAPWTETRKLQCMVVHNKFGLRFNEFGDLF